MGQKPKVEIRSEHALLWSDAIAGDTFTGAALLQCERG
ncbi:MAG: hypothetical protein JWO95_1347, partial [Verrucomicrobiales bacterium]|nr:hypothetical protein [Verrucomicrobiales bacterium]